MNKVLVLELENFFTKYGASLVAPSIKNLPAMQETQVQSLGWEDPMEERMATPLQYSCLENRMAS